jgi:hypothetical protein
VGPADTLRHCTSLRCCAARVRNAIVEVGPYIGGSTIALGRGIEVAAPGL